MKRVVEIRTYRLHTGLETEFDRLMWQEALPLLRAAGMEVVAARPSRDGEPTYTLIRAYDSVAHRDASQDAFYGSDAWRQGPREAVLACIVNFHSVVLDADDGMIGALRAVLG